MEDARAIQSAPDDGPFSDASLAESRVTTRSEDVCETVAICYRRDVVTVKRHKSLVKHRDYRFPSTITHTHIAADCAINLSIVARAREMLSNLEEGHLLYAHMFARVVAFLSIRAFAAFSATGICSSFFFLFADTWKVASRPALRDAD